MMSDWFRSSPALRKAIFLAAAVFCLSPLGSPPLALLLGLLVAQFAAHPFPGLKRSFTQWLLKASVVGLGFGMNLYQAMEAGKTGIVFTVFSILLTLGVGWLLGKWMRIDFKTSFLISSGTAICGGSAIAAVSPVIKAEANQISVALGIVFILNSVSLFIFPWLGQYFGLSQQEFGLWSAIAIHDTSSVVGAAGQFGSEALQVATTVKLARALWIIPLSLLTALLSREKNSRISIPYFIGWFIVAMCISTYLPDFTEIYKHLVWLAKKGLTLTLFLIGTGLSRQAVRSVGIRPLLQGLILWILISALSLLVIKVF